MKTFGSDYEIKASDWYELVRRGVERLEDGLPAANGNSTPPTVEITDNRIYFYSGVDSDRGLNFTRALREMDARLLTERIMRETEFETPIWVHVQSNGGQLFSGLAIKDSIKRIKSPTYSVVEGLCASAATLISLSCTRRFITPSGYMLIHQLSGGHWGTHESFTDEFNLQEKLMRDLVDFYTEHTKIPRIRVIEMLQRDTYFTAKECLKYGLVDEIVGKKKK